MKSPFVYVLPVFAATVMGLSSCVVGPPGPGPRVAVGVGYYDALPAGYDEPYYFYGGRYYYGGVWEPGRYRWHGHWVEGRYRHGGHVYYGGRWDAGHHGPHHR